MGDISRAFDAFTCHMASIGWGVLALGVVCHLAKGAFALARGGTCSTPRIRMCRSAGDRRSAATRPEWASTRFFRLAFGDLVRLYLMRGRIPGFSYPTLASLLLVEAIFDTLVSAVLVAWAIHAGLFPGLDVLPRLPSIDRLWAFHHPDAAATVVAVALTAGVALFAWAARHIEAFGRPLAQGVTILRTPREYVRHVVAWQLVEWPLRLATLGVFCTPSTCRRHCATRCWRRPRRASLPPSR